MYLSATITVGTSKINLLQALKGVVAGSSRTYPGLQDSACARLRLTSSPANAAASVIYIGGSDVSATTAAAALGVGVYILDETGVMNNISLLERWVVGSAAGLLLFVGVDFA